MKRFLKISVLVIAIVMTIVIACGVLLMSPPVQSAVTRKVLGELEKSMNGKFHFSSIAIRPFDAVVINDFVWTDNEPYFNQDMPRPTQLQGRRS